MIAKKRRIPARVALFLGAAVFLTVINTLFDLPWPLLAVQAGPTLPPRTPPTRSVPPDSDKKEKDRDDRDPKPIGASIYLQVHPAEAGLWTIVQWQDSAGGWHNVEGWQGTVDSAGDKRWWVAAKDFGTGPFRWIVTEGIGGQLLATSEPFNLPVQANAATRVEISLGP